SVDYGSNGTRIGSGLEILVNGVRQTIPAQASAFVELLPPLETVDTIEVVRGSNAAADGGSVSCKATVNITTRDPTFQNDSPVTIQASTREEYRLLAWHHESIADHHFSMALQYRQDKGFDQRRAIEDSDPQPILKDIKDDLRI